MRYLKYKKSYLWQYSIVCLLLWLCPTLSLALDMSKAAQPIPVALGNSFCAYPGTINAIFYNPANLATYKAEEIQFTAHRFGSENYQSLALMTEYMDFNLGLGLTQNEQDSIYYLASGKKIKKGLYLGTSLKYSESNSSQLNKNISFDLGVVYRLHRRLRLGFSIQNPFVWALNSQVFNAVNYKFGVWWRQKRLILVADLDYYNYENLIYHLGVEYHITKNLALRSGLDNGLLTAGFGYKLAPLNFDMSWHKNRDNAQENVYRFSLALKL